MLVQVRRRAVINVCFIFNLLMSFVDITAHMAKPCMKSAIIKIILQ